MQKSKIALIIITLVNNYYIQADLKNQATADENVAIIPAPKTCISCKKPLTGQVNFCKKCKIKKKSLYLVDLLRILTSPF